MVNIKILEDGSIEVAGRAVSDGINFDRIFFEFPKSWEGYVKTAVFSYNNAVYGVILQQGNPLCISENECYIPHEVLKKNGFDVSAFGTLGDSRATTQNAKVEVVESGYAEGQTPSEPTLSEYEQLVNLATETKLVAQSVRDDADSGAFNGEQGEPGEATPEFIAMVERTEENAQKTESARAALENGTVWIFDGGDADGAVDLDGDGEPDANTAGIKIVVDNEMSDESENTVKNRVIKEYVDNENKAIKEYIDNECYELSEQLAKQTDYIVEQGENGIWTYRKWNSGIAECWCTVHTVETPEWDTMSAVCNKMLPFEFVETPILNCSGGQLATHTSYVTMAASTTTLASAYIKCAHEINEEFPCWFNFDVKGRWK